jgi:hypothetical protein
MGRWARTKHKRGCEHNALLNTHVRFSAGGLRHKFAKEPVAVIVVVMLLCCGLLHRRVAKRRHHEQVRVCLCVRRVQMCVC